MQSKAYKTLLAHRKPYPALRTLKRLNAERKQLDIENDIISVRASTKSPRGHVGVTTVSNALNGLRKSMPVIEATRELIAEAKAAIANGTAA